MVNIKPSRVGGLEDLCATYDYCDEQGIGAYGGGQWELDVGRGQIQVLASLFHPDTPNDTAPRPYNEADPPAGLPTSPMPAGSRRPASAGTPEPRAGSFGRPNLGFGQPNPRNWLGSSQTPT